MQTMTVSSPTQVQRLALEALGRMKQASGDAEAINVGDACVKDIMSLSIEDVNREVAQVLSQVPEMVRVFPYLHESGKVMQEVGLSALAAGVTGPTGKVLATLGLQTLTAIREHTFWGRSGDDAGQELVAGKYLRAIQSGPTSSDERALASLAFSLESGQARCFNRVAFYSEALDMVASGTTDTSSAAALLDVRDKKFFQWPGGGD